MLKQQHVLMCLGEKAIRELEHVLVGRKREMEGRQGQLGSRGPAQQKGDKNI